MGSYGVYMDESRVMVTAVTSAHRPCLVVLGTFCLDLHNVAADKCHWTGYCRTPVGL